LDTDTLSDLFDYVSPDIDGASIAIGAASGRSGRGGLEFTVGADSDNFAYGQYGQVAITAAQTQTFGFAINQTATQGALGGRLLTLVDGAVDVFGETVQVAINIMPDSTLQATRANAQGTGIILRGIDQGVDAQMTLLGNSTDALIDTAYLEIQVFHHPTAGSIIANFYDLTHVLTSTWTLVNVNTAVSGANQSSSFCYGGYAATDLSFSQRYHEDLAAILSDVYVLNGLTNPDDARDPTSFLGDTAFILVEQTNNSVSEWTPDPAQANYLNVTEIPPDAGSTENTTFTVDDEDAGELTAVTGSTEEVILAYSADIKNDSSDTCVSGVPAEFEAFVYMTESEAGTCVTSTADASACNFTDFAGRRAQTVCTIAQDGDSVVFKPNLVNQDGMWVYLSPLDAPPRVLNALGPTRYQAAVFNLASGPMEIVAGRVAYTAPIDQLWRGYACDTQDDLDTNADFVQFEVAVHTSLDVVLIDNSQANLFNPYTSPFTGLHFREDIAGTPYFWIGDSFAYNGQTTYSYAATDYFTMTRVGSTDVEIRKNVTVLETVPVTFPTHTNVATFMGRWGWDAGTSDYSLQPFIQNVFVRIGGTDCVEGNYQQLSCTVAGTHTGNQIPESNIWGIQFDAGNGTVGDATVHDKNGPNNPIAPVFGYNESTQIEFALVGGNVVLTVTDWVTYADNMTTKVGNVATWDYTVPYADTDNFVLQPPASGYAVGNPTNPFPSIEYAFVDQTANQPLRLALMCNANSNYALPSHAGIKDTVFTFAPDPTVGPMSYAGQMTENTLKRAGTEALAPTNYHYKQSFLASTPADTAITVDDVNSPSTHSYKRSS
jgi:hypothetical protein